MKRSTKRKLKRKLREVIMYSYEHRKGLGLLCVLILLISICTIMIEVRIHETKEEIYEYVDKKVQSGLPKEKIVEKEKIVLKDPEIGYEKVSSFLMDVDNILQNPELPTGCEITSLATVINYLNPEINVDKVNLADNFLKKGEVGKTNPNEAFIGNPRYKNNSFGANAPVLVDAAQNYYALIDYPKTVEDLTGTEFKDLLKYTIEGYPVMIWATINMLEPYESVSWTVNGERITWIAQFHCVVLVGYSNSKGVYYVADPLKEGITEYDMTTLEKRYDQLGKQAVVVY